MTFVVWAFIFVILKSFHAGLVQITAVLFLIVHINYINLIVSLFHHYLLGCWLTFGLVELELGHLNWTQQIIHIFLVKYLILMSFEQRKNKFVEEYPFVLEKLVKKGTHVFARYYWREQSKNPLTCVNIGSQIESL